MFSAQSLLAGNGASVTCLRESRKPITTLNVATYQNAARGSEFLAMRLMVTPSLDRTVASRTHMRSLEMFTCGNNLQEHFDTLCDSFHDQHTRTKAQSNNSQ